MIICHVNGGLGNQMFQYAAAKSLATSFDVPLRFDLRAYKRSNQHQGFLLDKLFDIQVISASKKELYKVFGWPGLILTERLLTKSSNYINYGSNMCEQDFTASPCSEMKKFTKSCYLRGWWQSEQFFIKYKKKIADKFKFVQLIDEKNRYLIERMQKNTSLAVHIRRGDYVATAEARNTYAVCNDEYYMRAFDELAKKINIQKAYIFSDDNNWTKKNLRIPFDHEYVEHNTGEKSYIDMYLMTFCRAHIVANSSFSWWGAWLAEAWGNSDGLVVAPKKWGLREPMPVEVQPSRWILI